MGSGASNQIGSKDGSLPQDRHEDGLPNTVSGHDFSLNAKEDMTFSLPNKASVTSNSTADKSFQETTRKKTEKKSESSTTITSTNVLQQISSDMQNISSSQQLKKIQQLEKELANSESQQLDLQDQVTVLQERCRLADQHLPSLSESPKSLTETLHAKDQYIKKLEQDLKTAQAEFHKTCLKLKRRIRGLTRQLHEVRQEASINQMELKTQLSQQGDTMKQNTGKGFQDGKDGEISNGTSNSKVIVELSNQLSEQGEQIASLQSELQEKNQRIHKLEMALRDETITPPTTLSEAKRTYTETLNVDPVSTDRLPSGRGQRPYRNLNGNLLPPSATLSNKTGTDELWSEKRVNLSRQSTALSDSDSDWEMDTVPSHTHSAPARTRVRSAMSTGSDLRSIGDTLSILGDDDNFVGLKNSSETTVSVSHQRTRTQKKSALKNRLELQKKEKESSALMGPSIALNFASKSKEPPSDTSCEPTPRNTDPARLPGFSKLKVVHHTGS